MPLSFIGILNMYKNKKIAAIILLGGQGIRCQKSIPKQFALLGDKKLYLHTLETFAQIPSIDEIILVCHPDFIDSVKAEIPPYTIPINVIAGGKTRQNSSYRGLQQCNKNVDFVVVHDGARPFISKKIIEENIEKAFLHGAVDTCIPSADTIVHGIDDKIINIPNRKQYLRGQTPQSFAYNIVMEAHQHAIKQKITNATDDCQLVLALDYPIVIVEGEEQNLKVTTEHDFLLAEKIVEKSCLV